MSETKTLLETFTGIFKRVEAQTQTSYSDITDSTRVTPLCMVSNDLRNYEHTVPVMQSTLNIVTAYYMQALPMVANVGGVNVKKILDRLSPNAGMNRAGRYTGLESDVPDICGLAVPQLIKNITASVEESVAMIQLKLKVANKRLDREEEFLHNTRLSLHKLLSIATTTNSGATDKHRDKLIAMINKSRATIMSYKHDIRTIKLKIREARAGEKKAAKDAIKNDKIAVKKEKRDARAAKLIARKEKKLIKDARYKKAKTTVLHDMEASNLAVGKLVEVELKTENGDVTIPVTLMLQSKFVTTDIAAAMMSSHSVDATFTEGYYKVKSGRRTRRDFLLADTLIQKRKKLMIEDDHGLLQEIQKRRRTGQWNAALTGKSHVGVDNNVMIVTTDVIRAVEKEHRGKLSNQRMRKRIFDDLGIMILVVIDKEDEFVTFYYRNVRTPTDLPLKSLASVNSKNGPDIGDILKSLTQNTTPTF